MATCYLSRFQVFDDLKDLGMAFLGMALEDGLSPGLIQLDVPDLLGRRIAVGDPVLVIDEDHPLLHGIKDGG
jgi:hypothetical protein